ncbi:MAG: hypothetical protein V4520_09535 [Bacteroidota bacterium]
MRLVIIFLFALCQLITKAHDHTPEAKTSLEVSHARFEKSTCIDPYFQIADLDDIDDLVVDIDDDDSDNVSARKHLLLTKFVIGQFYVQLFSDYQKNYKNQFNDSSSLIVTTDKYIAQRVLRI